MIYFILKIPTGLKASGENRQISLCVLYIYSKLCDHSQKILEMKKISLIPPIITRLVFSISLI